MVLPMDTDDGEQRFTEEGMQLSKCFQAEPAIQHDAC